MHRRGDFVHIWADGYWSAGLVGKVGQVVDGQAYEIDDDGDAGDQVMRYFFTVEVRPGAYYNDETAWDDYLPEHLGPPIPGDDLSPWLIAELTR